MKECQACRLLKPETDFNISRGNHTDGLQGYCRNCQAEKFQAFFDANQPSLTAKRQQHRIENHIHSWAWATIYNHRKKGIEVQFSIQELETKAHDTVHCELCGCHLNWTRGHKYPLPDSPTLDNINQKTTLALKDIRITCFSCNRTKSNRTMTEFVRYCAFIVGKFAGTQNIG